MAGYQVVYTVALKNRKLLRRKQAKTIIKLEAARHYATAA